jgi:hypothetical protein
MQGYEATYTIPQQSTTKHDPHASKRIHLSPKSRRPPTPASLLSNEYFSNANMRPTTSACHLCHRQPKTILDLEAFTDCESCHERTCNVCVRSCEGPSCVSSNRHLTSKRVCGKCCTEVGVDGRVWCLSCYEDDENVEDHRIGPTKKDLQTDNLGRIAAWLDRCGDGSEVTNEGL